MHRRQLLYALALPFARPVLAQEMPRTIRLVVPFAAGASTDTLARLVASRLADAIGTSIVVENRAGAGGLLAVQLVARATPDGSVLLWSGQTAISLAVINRDPGYDVAKDFTPIATIVDHPALLSVRPASPFRDIQGLVPVARASPAGGLRYGSGGLATVAHMAGAALLKGLNADGTHVPYRGANQATLAVEQGEVDFAFAIANIVVPRMQQGAVRVLLSTAARRIPLLPDTPTMSEVIPGNIVITSASAIVGPAGMSPALVNRIHAGVNRLVNEDTALRDQLTREGGDINLSETPAAYAASWQDAIGRQRRLVDISGARVE